MTSHLMNTPQHLTREAFDAVVQDDADAVVTLAPV
ncbi:MAG: hypothetical protein JWQ77_2288, partial [Jatrophihabitans sp.]|nr:hypothetical protein [Jatrophihabitans sp.]